MPAQETLCSAILRFRTWRTRWIHRPLQREVAKDRVVEAARALSAKITKFEEMGTEHRILVEALTHLDDLLRTG